MEARETPHVAGRLAGKVAIIGGAGSIGPGWGNGKASATLMARAGAAVVAVDRDPDAAAQTVEIIRAEGGQAIAVEGDLSRSETAQKLVAETLSAFGRIDILHNNVGIVRTGGLVDTDEATWDMVHAVNLKSAYLTSQAVAPEMLKNGGGSMIHTASIAGIRHIGVDYLSYSTTKGALLPFSRSIALEYAGRGIRSNCILPGLMNTPMIRVGLRAPRLVAMSALTFDSSASNRSRTPLSRHQRQKFTCPMVVVKPQISVVFPRLFASNKAFL